ncbi:hypothetical protein F5I97DRAFT_1850685 [Phlebopus sp. FC_14]|nr:hypothetical protein F5I97DRAFT_1850685 [Phlebopus sp. FC_14]
MVLSKFALGWLAHAFKLVVSRGACCLRFILSLIRRLFGLLRRPIGPHVLNPRTKGFSTYASSRNICCSSDPQMTISRPSQPVGHATSSDVNAPSPSFALAPVSSNPPTIPPTPLPHTPDLEANRQLMSPTSASTKKMKKSTRPFPPDEVKRYERHVRISRKSMKGLISACTLEFKRSNDYGWERCVHPEGALYFCRKQDARRTITDSNLDDTRTRELMEYFTRRLWNKADKIDQVRSRTTVELVICVSQTADREVGQYYFVSHEDRLVFWLDDFVTDGIFCSVKGVEAPDHIRLAVETQYWAHCELYPNDVIIKESVVEELRDILTYATSEGVLSDASLTPLSVSELQLLLTLATSPIKTGQENKYLMCMIARVMRLFTRLQFINFFGQAGARLNADQSLYNRIDEDDREAFSPLIKIFDPILFSAPSTHVKQLRRLWVDHTINVLRWRSFINTLVSEWSGFTIYSTVMLAVDVSFLSVPKLNDNGLAQTLAQVAVYLSTLSAVGSLLASVLLTNQSRVQGLQSADQAASYMLKMAQSSVGLDALGIMFSIPFALTMWGMMFFVCGLSFVVFGLGGVAPRVTVIPFWMVVAMLASWPVWYAGERLLLWTRRDENEKKRGGRRRGSNTTVLPMTNTGGTNASNDYVRF